jgi:hypothetical protein
MQTPINSRDLALQNTSPRVLGINTNYVNLTCPTQQFKYGTDNAPQPALAVVTASLVGSLTGTVVFVTTGLDPVPQPSGNTITINPEHMTGDVVTINASLVYQGATYQAVPITISKIFNQLVAKTTRAIDLLPAYTDGSGYTLPAADNYIELYNGVVKLTTGVVYGPAVQTKGGLTAAVNASTGLINITQAAPNTWISNSESFTFTATRGAISYNTTYTITKAKQGSGGRQLAEVYLYQWLATQPNAPTGISQYVWSNTDHSYNGTDNWTTTVPVSPGGGVKLWKISLIVTAEASLTVGTISFTWAGGTVRQISTEANELIKTALLKIYKADIGLPVPPVGTSDYAWATKTLQAKPNLPGQPVNEVKPIGWELTEPEIFPGFKLWQASVSIIDSQGSATTNVDWTTASITAISYAGSTGVGSITAVLTNDTHAIPTDYQDTDTSRNFTNSGTDLFIYEGSSALTYDGEGTTAGTFKVTVLADGVSVGAATVVTTDSTGTVISNGTAGGIVGVRYANLTEATFNKSSTGSIIFTITGIRKIASGQTAGTPFTYTVKQTFTKTPSGDPSIVYWVTSSASVIQKNIAGTFTPAAITFTSKKSVGSITTDYSTSYVKFYKNNVLQSNVNSTHTYTIEANTTSLKYELYADSEFNNLLDSETVPVVSDGATGTASITAVLTNDTHAIPTDYQDTDTSRNFTNSGTDLFIYEGSTGLTYTPTGDGTGLGTFKVTATASGVTVGAASIVTIDSTGTVVANGTAGGIVGVRFANLTAAGFVKTGTGSIIFTVTGRRLNNTVFTYTVQQSFTKTPSGDPSIVYWVTSSASVIKSTTPVTGDATFTPTTITFTNKKSVGGTTTDYTGYVKFYRNNVDQNLSPANLATYTYTIEANTTSVRYELYSDSAFTNLLDSETVPVVSDGPKGDKGNTGTASITAVLTNDTHAIPTDSGDSVRNLTNSGTDLFIYEGATGLTYDGTGTSLGKFKVTTTVDGVTINTNSIAIVTINTSGTVVANGTAGGIIGVRFPDLATATFDKASTGSIIFTVSGRRLDDTVFSYIVKQTFTKTPSGVQGDPGFAYWITSTASVIQKNAAGAYNPATITFTAKKSSGSTASNYTTGYVKLFVNNVDQSLSPANQTAYTYTIAADTTSVRYELYSDSAFTNLLDSETVPVVSDGLSVKGDTGASARRAYVVVTSTPASTPATVTSTGDALPSAGTWWGTVQAPVTWTSTAPSAALTAGQVLYQSDGVYTPGANTVWGFPYISALKVGALSAITTNTGQLTIANGDAAGYIRGGNATTLTEGAGFFVDNSGYLRVGTPGAAQLKFDSSGLTISNAQGTNIFTVVSTAQTAASNSADAATIAANKATTAVAVAGSITWVGDSQIEVVTGTQLKRASGTGNWDYKKYSAESYIGGAYISFIPVSTVNDFMIGLNGNPATYTAGSSYAGIDYAWYVNGAAGLKIYESGTERTVSGTTSYTTSTVLAIIYDGRYVKYYRDGILARTVDTTEGSNLRHYADTAWANNNGEAKSIRFGPVGALGAKGDAATVSVGTITTGAAGTSASVTNSGTSSAAVLNFTIPKGADSTVKGDTGARGSLQGFGSKYGITLSDTLGNSAASQFPAKANRIISNLLTGGTSVENLDTTDLNRQGDLVTIALTNGTNALTRFWDGTSWVDPSVIINGNLIVTGTVGANKLASNFLSANWANIGTLDSSPDPLAPSSERLVITKDTLTVYSGNVVRVKLGKLT